MKSTNKQSTKPKNAKTPKKAKAKAETSELLAQQVRAQRAMIKVSSLKKNPENPRRIRDEKFEKLKASIQKFPQMMELRPMVVDETNTVLGGNMRLNAIKALGMTEIPDEWVKKASDLTEDQKKEFVIKDNSGFGEYDWDAIANEWSDLPLADWGLDVPGFEASIPSEPEAESEMMQAPEMLDDIVFASDNEYEIPCLLPETQATELLNPVMPYGAESRTKAGVGTYHFYVEDYRFESVWQKPGNVLNSGCVAITEPNISLFNTTPKAWAIFQTFRKRWIARFYQQFGVKVFVDLNVNQKFYELNMLGVPKGWKAFSTRAYADRIDALEAEIEIAKKWSGNKPLMFVVGGGEKAQKICQKEKVIYVENWMTERKEAMKANG